jgi:hypothetical protein
MTIISRPLPPIPAYLSATTQVAMIEAYLASGSTPSKCEIVLARGSIGEIAEDHPGSIHEIDGSFYFRGVPIRLREYPPVRGCRSIAARPQK